MPKPARMLIFVTFAIGAFLIGLHGINELAVFLPPICVIISIASFKVLGPLDTTDYSRETSYTDGYGPPRRSHPRLPEEAIARKQAERDRGAVGTLSRAFFIAEATASLGLGVHWFGLSLVAVIAGIVLAAIAAVVGFLLAVGFNLSIW